MKLLASKVLLNTLAHTQNLVNDCIVFMNPLIIIIEATYVNNRTL